MNKQDIIRQFGEAKYNAGLESAKKNEFQSVDILLMVNGEAVELFDFQLFEHIWYNSGLEKLERLDMVFEFFQELPLSTIVLQICLICGELNKKEIRAVWTWIESQLIQDGHHRDRVAYYLPEFLDKKKVRDEAFSAVLRKSAEPKVIREILIASAAVPYATKKELYNQLLKTQDKTWHHYILENLVYSLDWYGALNKEDAKKVYAQLEIPVYFAREQEIFEAEIEDYEEIAPPPKPQSRKKKKSYKQKWDV